MAPITTFAEGTLVNVLEIQGRPDLVHRMESMGIYPGKQAHIIRVLGQAIVIQTGHTRLAIRTSSHLQIMAETLPTSQRNTSLNYATA